MSREKRDFEEILRRSLSSPPPQMEAGLNRILAHLRADPADVVVAPTEFEAEAGPPWWWLKAAAAILLVAAVGTAIVWRPADDALYRVVEGNVRTGDTISSTGGGGSVLALADGSRVEMRSQTELSLERTDDGIRIRLNGGSIIVNAAKQRTGHLYVQTKDVTVSVVGTVFLVNADDEGSRVAVIEGEVRVLQGATEKKLRPGEQVATSLLSHPPPVADEIAWSRDAESHQALLQQSAGAAPSRAEATDVADVFEEATIRLRPAESDGGRGGAGGISVLKVGPSAGCAMGIPQVDPRRFAVHGTTLYTLIVWAYGTGNISPRGCVNYTALGQMSGGPGWIRSDQWDVEAVIPKGLLPTYSAQQLRSGEATALQRMLRRLLESRFGVVMRRETKEMPAYVMTAEKGFPKPVAVASDAEYLDLVKTPGAGLEGPGTVNGEGPVGVVWLKSAPLADIVPVLARITGRPVFDRTGLTDFFSFVFTFTPLDYNGPIPLEKRVSGPSVFRALQEQVGLKLESTTTLGETWIIERVDRPSEN